MTDDPATPESNEPAPEDPMEARFRQAAELNEKLATIGEAVARLVLLPPAELAKQLQVQSLNQAKDEWLEKQRQDPNRPQWQKGIDGMLESALTQVIHDGTKVDSQGNVKFDLNNQSLQEHAGPILQTLAQNVLQELTQKLLGGDLTQILAQKATAAVAQATQSTSTPAAGEGPEPEAPATDDAPASDDTEAAETTVEGPQVKVNFDLAGLLGSFLKPKTGAPAESSPATSDDDEAP